MFWMIAAAIFELFFSAVPEKTPVDQFLPMAQEVQGALRKKGWELKQFEGKEENTWIFWNLGPRTQNLNLKNRAKEKQILFTWEPPTVQSELHDPQVHALFSKIFTWDDDLVDQKRFFKFYYPSLKQRMKNIPSFEEKKFCTMIARNLKSNHPKQLYEERKQVIRFFEGKKRGEFDLYGVGWKKKKYKNYRGFIANKMEVLKNYKFSICYENTRDVKGYITEKIFDCFAAAVVPVYWGASNVEEYIPENCFIDRRKFKSDQEVYVFLKGMKKEQWEEFVKNGEIFIKSEKAKVFSAEHFAKVFMQVVD